jgi:phosphonate degradation associated HDIG domain protein
VTDIVSEIFDLFARFGAETYGEDLSIERHMLQSASLAQSLGASDPVVAAALLHDIGYFLQADSEDPAQAGRDTPHEVLGAAWLSRAFDEDVTAPIALHVQAKRYLCAIEPGYFDQLSDASRLSLAVQGGVMEEAEVAAFAREPAFEAALLLRRCDDRGKDVVVRTQDIGQFRALLTSCRRRPD